MGGGVELYIIVGGGVERGRLAEGFMRGLQMSRGRRIPLGRRLRSSDPFHPRIAGVYNGVYRCPPTLLVDIYCFTIRVAAPMMTADTSLKSPTWNRLRRPPEGHIYIYIACNYGGSYI